MALKILITWALFIPIAITNGIARDLLYRPIVGDLAAHQISTLLAIAAFISLVYFLRRGDFKYLSYFRLVGIGVIWVILTIIFEFGFGFYLDKVPFEKLLADYNIFEGRVWSLMLITELFTPLVVCVISNRRG
jgi:hypothetical protein